MKVTLFIFIHSLFIFSSIKLSAQLVNCNGSDSSKLFYQQGSEIFRFDPTLPVSATNPVSIFTSPTTMGGIAIANNINSAVPQWTFYTTNGNYNLLDISNIWVNTTHASSAVNLGGGGSAIYNKNGSTGELYKYTATGNDVLLTNTGGGIGPYDVAVDIQDNFYSLVVNTIPGKLYKYNPLGVLVDSVTIMNSIASTAGGGFAILGSQVYFTEGAGISGGPIINDTVNPVSIPNTNFLISDMASCPVFVNFNPFPLYLTYTTCNGSQTLSFNSQYSSTTATYLWNFGDPLSGANNTSTLANPVHNFSSNGIYTVSVITNSAQGSDTITQQITVNTYIYSTLTKSICAPNSYAGHSVTGTYIDTLIGVVGCDTIQTLQLTVLPIIKTSLDTTICEGSSVNGHSNTGIYTDTYSAANGCDSILTLNLVVTPTQHSYLQLDICEGDTALGYTQSGIYQDIFQSANQCDSIRHLTLVVHTLPNTQISLVDQEICRGDTVSFKANGALSYEWYREMIWGIPSSTSDNWLLPIYINPTKIIVVGKSSEGCKQSAEMTINYTSCCGPISVPNAFSPNGDMINDEFKILSQNDFEFFNMKVYNRYGQLVFEGKNSHNVWDGRLAGRNAEMGTYFYIIQTRCHLQEKNTILKGDLLLVR